MQASDAYIFTQTKSGIPIHWASSVSLIDIYVNPQNNLSLNEETVDSIAANSISEWNNLSRINLRKNSTTLKNQPGINEIYFSSDDIFGSGVAGLTLVEFREFDGQIIGADVVINENLFQTPSTNPTNDLYLGNIFTHELGHLLGLSHGQVMGSTMFYLTSLGQYKISDDEKAAIFTLYPTGDQSKGTLTGKIVGGKKLASVFGAQVQAISVKTGKVMGASISELDGKFTIGGLPRFDQYYIYTSPVKQIGIPNNYANARNDFCESSKPYRGSFYQACGGNSEGFPEAIKLESTSVNVGNISIRCNLDSPPEYLQKKNSINKDFNINSYTQSGLGGSFVGFFSNSEIQKSVNSEVYDSFHVDLTSVGNWNLYSTSTSLYLEVKVLSQSFNSIFKPNVFVSNSTASYVTVPSYALENDNRINIDSSIHYPIDLQDSSKNNFSIKVQPVLGTDPGNTILNDTTNFSSDIPYSKSQIFPGIDSLSSSSNFQDGLYFYFVITTIVSKNSDGINYTQVASKNDLISDNTNCPDAINTYALNNYSANGISTKNNRNGIVACGTISDKNNTSGGPGGFFVGLLFCVIIFNLLNRNNKYSTR